VVGPDESSACFARGTFESLLQPRHDRNAALAGPGPFESARSEGFFDSCPHLAQIDPQGA
jgi:hypothetical protein